MTEDKILETQNRNPTTKNNWRAPKMVPSAIFSSLATVCKIIIIKSFEILNNIF